MWRSSSARVERLVERGGAGAASASAQRDGDERDAACARRETTLRAMESPRHPRFPVHRCAVRDGLAIGYWRAGEGGYPLLLVHGFPETKRIWARNVAPLAAAGFDVIVPDLRGVGDSDPAPDGFYDPPAYARDLHALCAQLGIERCGAVAGDVGAMVVAELGLRFPGFVERQCLFNTLAPPLLAAFAAAGIPEDPPP